jgi:methyltransferase
MDMRLAAYLLLLGAVGLGRLLELRVSGRNRRRLAVQGVGHVAERHFRWMVLLHVGVLMSAGLEAALLHRRFIPGLALTMGLLFVSANGLRWWVIRSLSEHWNVGVMASTRLGVVTRGPYRWVRHPNYLAVFIELLALPLIYTAWITALVGGIAHVWVLRRRLAVEEATLAADPNYQAAMGGKPRFLPRLFSRSAGSRSLLKESAAHGAEKAGQ